MKNLKHIIRFLILLLLGCLMGCAARTAVMPTIEMPTEPTKPAIKSSVIIQNSIPWVCYSLNDSLKLYEFLLQKDSYEEKLRYRIDSMNQLWQGK